MRISKSASVIASSALAASVISGGAGVAGAQSPYSQMQKSPDVGLTVAGDTEAIGDTITNNTADDLVCHVVATDRDVVAEFQTLVEGGMATEDAFEQLDDEIQAANDEGRNAIVRGVQVGAGAAVPWLGRGYEPAEDPDSGALAVCDGLWRAGRVRLRGRGAARLAGRSGQLSPRTEPGAPAHCLPRATPSPNAGGGVVRISTLCCATLAAPGIDRVSGCIVRERPSRKAVDLHGTRSIGAKRGGSAPVDGRHLYPQGRVPLCRQREGCATMRICRPAIAMTRQSLSGERRHSSGLSTVANRSW